MADEIDPITQEELDALEACQTADEWNDLCSIIKGLREKSYPPDWWEKVMVSGLADRVFKRWEGDTQLRIVGLR